MFERSGWPPWLTAFLLLAAAFIFFQVLVAPIAVVMFLLMDGVAATDLIGVLTDPAQQATHIVSMIKANTVGQFFGLALPTLLMARLHASQIWAFMRVRKADLLMTLLAGIGTLGLFPLVQVVGQWGDMLPWPESVRAFEQAQMDMIEGYLLQGPSLWFSLFALAVTPAICEELLFRGYLQRQVERSWGVPMSILLVGVFFGAYHFRLTQVLALSMIGIYLGFVTWRTGSLLPAVLVHFLHNGSMVLLASTLADSPAASIETVEGWAVPWYLVLLGVALISGVVWLMNRLAQQHLARRATHLAMPTPIPNE